MTYEEFIKSKSRSVAPSGFECGDLNPRMKPFQQAVVRWALRGGKRMVGGGTGTGKTLVELEWGHQVADHTGGNILHLTPLSVAEQTESEARKFGVSGVAVVDAPSNDRIQITNYEKLHRFNPKDYTGIVIDEASICKSFDGEFRKRITEFSQAIPFRLPASATPAPNDYMELGSYAEYLGVMTTQEMLAMFFTHDGGDTSKWRLKGHAQSKFWAWVASWAVFYRKPSDIGFDDAGYDLPPLEMIQHTIKAEAMPGELFVREAETLQDRQKARASTIDDRVAKAAELVAANDEQWICWCNLNAESEALTKAIVGAVEITGSQTAERKRDAMLDFIAGKTRVIVSKPSLCGFGLNLQFSRNMAFVGLSDSWEQFYQALRRQWRFGQELAVYAHVITSELEGAVVRNIQRKEEQVQKMMEGMIEHMKPEMDKQLGATVADKTEYLPRIPMQVPAWCVTGGVEW